MSQNTVERELLKVYSVFTVVNIMKAIDFKAWIAALLQMTGSQRDRVREQLGSKASSDLCLKLIEQSFTEQRQCPHCTCKELYLWGKSSGLQRYRCRDCKRTFNALTKTSLAGLHQRDKWLDYEKAMTDGNSIRKAAASCGIAKNTSFQWRHRFLGVPSTQQPKQMAGIIEADETFFLESFKGQRNLPRPAHKRGTKASKRGTSVEQIPVLVVRDRHGETADFVLQGVASKDIEPSLKPLLNKDSILCTDGARAYISIAKNAGVTHRPINVAAGKRVVAGVYHIQNVNAYDSRLKQWMLRFHGVATYYLEHYLGWHRMIDHYGQSISPSCCLLASLGRERRFQQYFAT